MHLPQSLRHQTWNSGIKAGPGAFVVFQDSSLRNDRLPYRAAQADPVDSAARPLPNARPPSRMLTTTPDGLNHSLREQPAADLSETRM